MGVRAGPDGSGVRLQRPGSRPAHRRGGRRGGRGPPDEQPAPGDDDPLARSCAFPPTWTAPRRCSRRSQPGETFEYRFVVPDAGTFWYHSHTNETEQLERGLYGALIVRGHDEPASRWRAGPGSRRSQARPQGRASRRFGDFNERHAAAEGDMRSGERRSRARARDRRRAQVERWRIVNASSARYVRLSLGGRPFAIIGTDGGLLTRAATGDRGSAHARRSRRARRRAVRRKARRSAIESLPYDRGAWRSERRRAVRDAASRAARALARADPGDAAGDRAARLQMDAATGPCARRAMSVATASTG